MSIPVMMTVAGSDCSAGAGLQADMKAAHAMGAFALTAVTCVVSEAPGLVRGIQRWTLSWWRTRCASIWSIFR